MQRRRVRAGPPWNGRETAGGGRPGNTAATMKRIGTRIAEFSVHRLGYNPSAIFGVDMYEHAYHIGFGAAAARYIDAFLANVNWEEVSRRAEWAQKAKRA